MPELAEVEFYRKQWNCGLKQKIVGVHLHAQKRIFRGTDTKQLEQTLTGASLIESRAHGKQMLFRFSGGGWLGVHLGMTGKMRAEKTSGYTPQTHDHLVLQQKKQALVFSDPRQFGRVLFHHGTDEPRWWSQLPPSLTSPLFTVETLGTFLKRHGKAPLKAVLLLQNGFPGVGNWMADEILWQAKIHPRTSAGQITGPDLKTLFLKTQFVCRQALKIIGEDFSDPPKSWLFQHRWRKKGICPRCQSTLTHDTVGGRTTCWCLVCQPDQKEKTNAPIRM